MYSSYFKYFSHYIITSKHRQKLLILSVVGLFISSFALIVLQSSMGGLQNKLMERSKKISGFAVIFFNQDVNSNSLLSLEESLKKLDIFYSKEFELELLLKNQTLVTPVIVHGIDSNHFLPPFLNKKGFNGAIPHELSYKIGSAPPIKLQLISPSHTDSILGDIPRTQSINISDLVTTDVPEIDNYHLWVKLSSIQNLIQSRSLNRIRIYSKINIDEIKKIIPMNFRIKTWEEENKTLVWALKLESIVMIFLFGAMSLLVSLCITSGLMIFFNKIKTDLSSFWILGASYSKITEATKWFLYSMSFLSVFLGILCGVIFLKTFDYYAPEIMPDVFVDRKIPVLITKQGILISFLIPYTVSIIFIRYTLTQFKNEYNLLNHVRSVS